MSAESRWQTTLDPDTRRLPTTACGALDAAGTQGPLNRLMGRGEAQVRRDLMEVHGDTVELDV